MQPLIDSSSLYDIEGPLSLSRGLSMYIVLVLVALLIAIGIAYYLYRKKQYNCPQAPIFNPYEAALKGLSHLDTKAPSALFASSLDKILKTFLQAKIAKPILHNTTEEFLASIAANIQDTELLHNLSCSLRQYDLVKFSKAPLPEEERYLHIDSTKRLIEAIQTSYSHNPHPKA